MSALLTASEQAQLDQTIEMFEVITQSQPLDYQSLEILKEAYAKTGREQDVLNTSKRIAQAYVQLGQFSSAILEYESILQQHPDDPDVRGALEDIENKANCFAGPSATVSPAVAGPVATTLEAEVASAEAAYDDLDDGRVLMHKIFIDGRVISQADFDLYWPKPDLRASVATVREPFIQVLDDKGLVPLEKSLRLLSERGHLAYLPLERYDTDPDLARRFPRDACLRWCVLPFDRMSKSVLVATANPFNKTAAIELENAGAQRVVWYLAKPVEISKLLRKIFR